jgi:hypothetical protein
LWLSVIFEVEFCNERKGVIPKTRVFSSGARDLAWSEIGSDTREILHDAGKAAALRACPAVERMNTTRSDPTSFPSHILRIDQ